ncbi:bifunctional RNase H/acid phosphatase [Aeromicrobium phragmitis]|uniref:Bifunctional RNase H/acid phosphatase n=1 Tax=Aeromicrobium phragmitis TaxID=2478914 RepID=A0A3L8PKZ7_9ACTN|nr:bifunctional RNase H/acid phosphatase [Aeromicrobium phragmitis]RLV56001.1 bifunctional RNase H/acid phosphatase [Aeromicrobium phragmitis]
MTPRVIVEADGGSRGNPGPAALGAVLRDATSGAVIAQRGEVIGTATNNVAEYRALIAGLELAREHTPDAQVEVRMDSKLVIEQMSGRWKINHPDMKPLALEAQVIVRELLPITWTWVPRDDNKAADALVNAALDGKLPDATTDVVWAPARGWSAGTGEPTTLILVRHGVTPFTERKAFSGMGTSDPELTEVGHEQAARAAAWIDEHGGADAVVASPLRRTRETADHVCRRLGLEVAVDEGLAETSFGEWDGYTFAEIQERWPNEVTAWLGSTAVAPPGGEAFDVVLERVTATRDRLLEQYAGKTVVAVTHVTPIKMLVGLALGAPITAIYRMELAPASISTVAWWPDGNASLRSFNAVP